MSNNRVAYWDISKAFGMFLVVYGHMMFAYDSRGVNTPLNLWIYSFHMALFFIISGYFFSSSLKKEFLTLLKAKILQLLVPVISWSVISFIINELLLTPSSDIGSCIYDFIRSGQIIKGFWFLKALFVYYMSAYIAVYIFKIEWIAGLLCIVTISLLPNYGFIAIFPVFFWVGHFMRKYNYWLQNKYTLFISFILSILSFILWRSEYSYISQRMDLISISMRFFAGISWSLTVILLSKRLSKVFEAKQIVGWCAKIGTASLGIYCMHETLFMNVWWDSFYDALKHNDDIMLFLIAITCYLFTYYIYMLLIKINIVKMLLFG